MSELTVLQAVRMKGRVSPTDLAQTLGEDDVDAVVAQLAAADLLIDGATLRMTPAGRVRLTDLLATERAGADAAVLDSAYAEFRTVNQDFKALVTDWQLKDGAPNSHADAAYDAAVLARLDDVHRRVAPIVDAAASQLPRLHAYWAKLVAAREKINTGEVAWLTRPLIDSYHTVWFELHEELIGAVGLTREQAARSGDAQ
jgi:hypothetical protein